MANNSSELFVLANQIRKEMGLTQKEAFAEARKRIAEKESAMTETTKPAGKKRGNYVRDDAWKAKHAEDMRLAWARRKANKVAA